MRGSTFACVGLALLAVGSLGCAAVPDQGKRNLHESADGIESDLELSSWKATKVPGFEIYSNGAPEKVSLTLRRFEQFVAMVSRFVYGRRFPTEHPVEILLFRTNDQYERFAPESAVGYAHPSGEHPSIAMTQDSRGIAALAVLNHELVHIIQGLAEFFSSTTIRDDVIRYGTFPKHRMSAIRGMRPFPLRSLLSSGKAGGHRYYGYAWLFVHYGFLSEQFGGVNRVEQFWRFVSLESQGVPWRDAFERAFDAPIEKIETEFVAHRKRVLQSALTPQGNITIELDEVSYGFESVGRLVMAARLARHAARNPAKTANLADALFKLVLDDSPSDASALNGRIRMAAFLKEFQRAGKLWKQLLSVPKSADAGERPLTRALLVHAQYRALDGEERASTGAHLIREARSEYLEVLEIHPNWITPLLELGDTYVLEESANPAPGIKYIDRALKRGSGLPPEARLNLAKLMLRSGDPDGALPHLQIVVSAHRGSDSASEARSLLRRHY